MAKETVVVEVQKLISNNKAIAAAVTSFAGVEVAALAEWVTSGKFNMTETRTAVGGLLLALGTYAVTWVTGAGKAEVKVEAPAPLPDLPPVPPAV